MKTKKRIQYLGMIGAAVVLSLSHVRADNTLTYSKVSKDGSANEAQKMLISGAKMRVDMSDGKNAIIYDAAVDKVYILELAAKKYMAMDPAVMAKMTGALSGLQTQLEAQLASMPEAQREKMRAMMNKMGQGLLGGGKAPELKYVETGRSEKVGDYQTQVIEVLEGGKKSAVYYVVDRQALKIGDEEYATLQKFQTFMGKLMKSLPGPLKKKIQIQALMAQGSQLPVKAEHFENSIHKRTDQLTEISDEALNASLFEIPEGFQERQLPTAGGGL